MAYCKERKYLLCLLHPFLAKTVKFLTAKVASGISARPIIHFSIRLSPEVQFYLLCSEAPNIPSLTLASPARMVHFSTLRDKHRCFTSHQTLNHILITHVLFLFQIPHYMPSARLPRHLWSVTVFPLFPVLMTLTVLGMRLQYAWQCSSMGGRRMFSLWVHWGRRFRGKNTREMQCPSCQVSPVTVHYQHDITAHADHNHLALVVVLRVLPFLHSIIYCRSLSAAHYALLSEGGNFRLYLLERVYLHTLPEILR